MPINDEILNRLDKLRQEINEVPFIVFVWGPGIAVETPQATKRKKIRDFLGSVVGAENVFFSEDEELRKAMPEGEFAAEFMQASVADAVILIPESPGSITESASFQQVLRGKTIVFCVRREPGFAQYAYKLLIREDVEPEEWIDCKRIRAKAKDFVEQLRIEKFRSAVA